MDKFVSIHGTAGGNPSAIKHTFDHIVTTRFNVRMSKVADLPSDDWLRRRLQIFKATALASMSNQTATPLAWVILCDSSTPQYVRDALTKLLDAPWQHLAVHDGVFGAESAVRAIRQFRSDSTSHLISTRIDNDDWVKSSFIANIEKSFEGQDFEFVNFPLGFQRTHAGATVKFDPSGPFISLIENSPKGSERGVWLTDHNLLGKHGAIRQRWGAPCWAQNVHGDNLANEATGLAVPASWLISGFPESIRLFGDQQETYVWRLLRSIGLQAKRVLKHPERAAKLFTLIPLRGNRGTR